MLNKAGKKTGEKKKKYTNRNENNERSEKNDPEGGVVVLNFAPNVVPLWVAAEASAATTGARGDATVVRAPGLCPSFEKSSSGTTLKEANRERESEARFLLFGNPSRQGHVGLGFATVFSPARSSSAAPRFFYEPQRRRNGAGG